MKQCYLLAILFFFSLNSYAQPNSFPSSGNVGIGTASPNFKLDVVGNANVSAGFYLGGTCVFSAGNYLQNMANGNGSTYNGGAIKTDFIGLTTPSVGGWYRVLQTNSTNARGGGSLTVFSTGNYFTPSAVKIEFTCDWNVPTLAMHLKSSGINMNITDVRIVTDNATNYAYLEIYWIGTAVQGIQAAFEHNWGSNSNWSLMNMTASSGNISERAKLNVQNAGLSTTGNIYTDGNIGIGTTSPSEKLSVNGNIKTKKLIVTQTNWPDYVFHPAYQLQPLDEVEKFVQVNRHLPGVPSEKEVAKDGVDVGENQAVLLKKIEELTLYMISLQKQVNELKTKLDGKK